MPIEGMDMDITPNTYKSWGDVLQKYSEDVINEVKKRNKTFEYVIDFGSGLGNNSELLFRNLKINNLIGVDIDQNMIEYANNRKSDNKMQFMAQDVSLEWSKVRPELKELEGKIELILSSFVLHFIADRKNTAQNLYRLLAPGAHFYGNVICLDEFFNNMQIDMKIPSSQQQLYLWTEAFTDAGFKIEKTRLYKLETTMTVDTYERTFASIISLCYEIFMSEEDPIKRKQMVSQVKNQMMKTVTKFKGDMNDTELVRCECEIFTVKIIKT